VVAVVDTALGFRQHTGWAVLVAVGVVDGKPTVLDRRRIEMVDDDRDAYHAAAERSASPEAGEALVDRIAREAADGAASAIAAAVGDLGEAGHRVIAAGVASGRSLPPLASILRSHAMLHAAEGELYRAALEEGASGNHLRVTVAPLKTLFPYAAGVLGEDEGSLTRTLAALGKSLGPPWQRDHREAALLAWLALAGPVNEST
jgi:hypothetical protein